MNIPISTTPPITLPSDQDATGRTLGDEEIALLAEAIGSGTLTATKGKFTKRLETEFAAKDVGQQGLVHVPGDAVDFARVHHHRQRAGFHARGKRRQDVDKLLVGQSFHLRRCRGVGGVTVIKRAGLAITPRDDIWRCPVARRLSRFVPKQQRVTSGGRLQPAGGRRY